MSRRFRCLKKSLLNGIMRLIVLCHDVILRMKNGLKSQYQIETSNNNINTVGSLKIYMNEVYNISFIDQTYYGGPDTTILLDNYSLKDDDEISMVYKSCGGFD